MAALEELCAHAPEAARSIAARLITDRRRDTEVRAFAVHCAVVHSWLPDRLREVTDTQAGAVLVDLLTEIANHPTASGLIDSGTRQWLIDAVPVGRIEWLCLWKDLGVAEASDAWRRRVRMNPAAAAADLADLGPICDQPPEDLACRLGRIAWFSSFRLAELGMGYNDTRPPRLREAVAWLSWVRKEFGRILRAETGQVKG